MQLHACLLLFIITTGKEICQSLDIVHLNPLYISVYIRFIAT